MEVDRYSCSSCVQSFDFFGHVIVYGDDVGVVKLQSTTNLNEVRPDKKDKNLTWIDGIWCL